MFLCSTVNVICCAVPFPILCKQTKPFRPLSALPFNALRNAAMPHMEHTIAPQLLHDAIMHCLQCRLTVKTRTKLSRRQVRQNRSWKLQVRGHPLATGCQGKQKRHKALTPWLRFDLLRHGAHACGTPLHLCLRLCLHPCHLRQLRGDRWSQTHRYGCPAAPTSH